MANVAVQERHEWDSTVVYEGYSQDGDEPEHTEDYEDDIQ